MESRPLSASRPPMKADGRSPRSNAANAIPVPSRAPTARGRLRVQGAICWGRSFPVTDVLNGLTCDLGWKAGANFVINKANGCCVASPLQIQQKATHRNMNIDKCPKCGAKMQEGFLIESKLPLRWMAGKPERSVLGGTTAKGREQRQIESYCCVECGHLELYARAVIS
jgi:Domain of unknown function (DUF6487)